MRRSSLLGITVMLGCLATVFGAPLSASRTGHGIDVSGMDFSVKVKSPADLYGYANGSWLDRTAIPADKSYVGTSDEIQESNFSILKEIAEQAALGKANPGSRATQLVGGFYRLAMNVRQLEKLGGKLLTPELGRIDLVRDRSSLATEIGHLHSLGVPVGFAIDVQPDERDTSRERFSIAQGGLTLHGRQLYLDLDDHSRAIRSQYIASITRLMSLAKIQDGVNQAQSSLSIEASLASATSSQFELRDRKSNYNPVTFEELQKVAPSFPWTDYFRAIGIGTPGSINVQQPKFLSAFSKALLDFPISSWKSYLRSSVLMTWSPFLSDRFVQAQTGLIRAITGDVSIAPRWKRAVLTIDTLVGDALGQLFVEKTLSQSARNKARTLASSVKSALRSRISELDWMTPDTQTRAIKKLDSMAIKVGFPSSWKDYAGLSTKTNSYLLLVLRASAVKWKLKLASLNHPVDRSAWDISSLDTHVTYCFQRNEVLIPASVLQPGYFDVQADEASNYGAIGTIIGHEIIHGFDAEGAQYDENGILRTWWTDDDKALYDEAASNIVSQYAKLRSPEDLAVNSVLTLNENIADSGGLSLAYSAFRNSLGYSSAKDGMSPDQRFFVAFAQAYRSHIRPELARILINIDPHSPDAVRVLGAASDQPEFFKAFGLPVPKYVPHLW